MGANGIQVNFDRPDRLFRLLRDGGDFGGALDFGALDAEFSRRSRDAAFLAVPTAIGAATFIPDKLSGLSFLLRQPHPLRDLVGALLLREGPA